MIFQVLRPSYQESMAIYQQMVLHRYLPPQALLLNLGQSHSRPVQVAHQ